MSRNTLEALNDHLFMSLERLNEEDISIEDLNKEVDRSKAINGVADKIISNAKLALDVTKFVATDLPGDLKVPQQLKIKQ